MRIGAGAQMKTKFLKQLLFLFFLFFLLSRFSVLVCQRAACVQLLTTQPESSDFRRQTFSERSLVQIELFCRQSQMERSELMTVIAARAGAGHVPALQNWKAEDFVKWKKILLRNCPEDYERINQAYAAVWNDIRCFPVAAADTAYENSWMFERNYGGKRGHEGCDLMPPENLPGHYRIVSITDGVVEKIGWLPQGGYRIGIRSPSGGYFYYAHLDSYSADFQIGDEVTAGMELGKMGDTGYGEEGTRGKFDVHLHLGIYIRTADTPELSVNPYWVLRCLEMAEGTEQNKGDTM